MRKEIRKAAAALAGASMVLGLFAPVLAQDAQPLQQEEAPAEFDQPWSGQDSEYTDLSAQDLYWQGELPRAVLNEESGTATWSLPSEEVLKANEDLVLDALAEMESQAAGTQEAAAREHEETENTAVPYVFDYGAGITQVSNPDTLPSRMVCKIIGFFTDSSGKVQAAVQGTGSFINGDTLVSAAHVMYSWKASLSAARKKIPDIIYIIPAASGWCTETVENRTYPYGLTHAAHVELPSQWLASEDYNYDISVIKSEEPLGLKTGSFRLSDQAPAGTQVRAFGYPGVTKNGIDEYDQYTSEGTIAKAGYSMLYSSDLRAVGGQSGGPVLDNSGALVGIISGSDNSQGKDMLRITAMSGMRKYFAETSASRLTTIYRVYNPNSGEHVHTKEWSEVEDVVSHGWNYEGVSWYAAPSASQGQAVYRVYNPNAGDHHYTKDFAEVQTLIRAGWRFEKIAWYAPRTSDIPVYRLYNPNAKAGAHHYTVDYAESRSLIRAGWKDEGVSWHGNVAFPS